MFAVRSVQTNATRTDAATDCVIDQTDSGLLPAAG
jgi:hypothetical protein